jgi:hypothetical protein
VDDLDAPDADASAVADQIRRAVADNGLVELVAIAHDQQTHALTVYWHGDVPAGLALHGTDAEVPINIVAVPFPQARIMAVVEYIVGVHRQPAPFRLSHVGPRSDWTGVTVGIDPADVAVARASLAESMRAAPADIGEVPVTVEGTTARFVPAPYRTTQCPLIGYDRSTGDGDGRA